MSPANAELAHRGVDAFNERDLDAFLTLAAQDCLYVVALPFDGEYRGHDGLRRWWKELFAAVPDFTAELVEVREHKERTVSAVRYRGHGADSDAPFEQVRWQVGEWRDGKLVGMRTYASEPEALEAVRLSETAQSQKNLEVVQNALRAFDARDIDALLPSYADDVEWRLIGGFEDLMEGDGQGHDAVRAAFAEWMDLGVRSEVESVRAVGDQVLVVGRFVGTSDASGAAYRSPRGAQLYTFRDGRICAVDNYYDAAVALEAVGLHAP